MNSINIIYNIVKYIILVIILICSFTYIPQKILPISDIIIIILIVIFSLIILDLNVLKIL